MAHKFGRIEAPRIIPERDSAGEDIQDLARQMNAALDQIVTQISKVLRHATAQMPDQGLWGRYEIVEFNLQDYGTDKVPIKVRHGLGSVPRGWFIWGLKKQGNANAVTSLFDLTIYESDQNDWTDKHVFFEASQTNKADIRVKIALIA